MGQHLSNLNLFIMRFCKNSQKSHKEIVFKGLISDMQSQTKNSNLLSNLNLLIIGKQPRKSQMSNIHLMEMCIVHGGALRITFQFDLGNSYIHQDCRFKNAQKGVIRLLCKTNSWEFGQKRKIAVPGGNYLNLGLNAPFRGQSLLFTTCATLFKINKLSCTIGCNPATKSCPWRPIHLYFG